MQPHVPNLGMMPSELTALVRPLWMVYYAATPLQRGISKKLEARK